MAVICCFSVANPELYIFLTNSRKSPSLTSCIDYISKPFMNFNMRLRGNDIYRYQHYINPLPLPSRPCDVVRISLLPLLYR
jgi:hypothetical protein